MSEQSRTYAEAGIWSLVAHGTQLVGSLGLSVVVVRMLSVEQLGELALGRQLTALLAVAGSLALERTLVRFVPELVERGAPAAAQRLVLSLLRLRLVVGTVIAILAILFRGAIAELVGIQDPGVVSVAAASGIAFSLAAHLRAAANAWFASRRVAQAAVLSVGLTFAVTVLAIWLGYGVLTILAVAALAMLVGAAWTWRAAVGPGGGGGEPVARHRLVGYTAPFAVIVLMNQLVHSQTEVFFLGRLRGPEDAAYFQYGFVLAQRLIDFLPLALWEVSMAAFAREDTAGDRDLREVAHRYLRLTYVAILPVAAVGVLLSPATVEVLYGPKMGPSVIVAQAYFVLGALAAFGAPMGMILYAREKTGLVLRLYLLATVVNLGLDWWLVSRFGLSGAIAGLAAAKLLVVVVMSAFAARHIGGLSVPLGTILRAFAASLGVFAWWWVGAGLTGIWDLLGGAIFSGIVVILLYRMFRVVAPEDGRLLATARVPGGGLLARLVTVGDGRNRE
jgi:O-antigen/teichoic acid export membrane protein